MNVIALKGCGIFGVMVWDMTSFGKERIKKADNGNKRQEGRLRRT